MLPVYDLDKIRFGTDPATFEKAVDLYGKGKVTKFEENIRAYSAVVIGTKPYQVSVEARHYDYGHCTCYLGEQDILCKHMVALAVYAILRGKPITEEEKKTITSPISSGKLSELSKEELSRIKKSITDSLRYIKAYTGPSRTWFTYQGSLSEGVARMSAIISELPVNKQTAEILIDLLLRLDKKVCNGGVDDSDGTVGTFMQEVVIVLQDYAKLDPKVIKSFKKFENRETCFDWEEPLVKLIPKTNSKKLPSLEVLCGNSKLLWKEKRFIACLTLRSLPNSQLCLPRSEPKVLLFGAFIMLSRALGISVNQLLLFTAPSVFRQIHRTGRVTVLLQPPFQDKS